MIDLHNCSAPIFQTSYERTAIAVYLALLLSFMTYARFCYLVINDITNFLGIACFTVRKKDLGGNWRSAGSVDALSATTINGDAKGKSE